MGSIKHGIHTTCEARKGRDLGWGSAQGPLVRLPRCVPGTLQMSLDSKDNASWDHRAARGRAGRGPRFVWLQEPTHWIH